MPRPQCRNDFAYVRELLRRAGYDVHTSSQIGDALLLMRVTRFDLLLASTEITSPSAPQAFKTASAKLPIIELGSEFSTLDAGEAASSLLETIAARFNSKNAQS